MNNGSRRFRVTPLALLRGLFGLVGDRRGNIAAMTALLIVPLVGAFGMAIDLGDWYMNQRAIQNAADSAAIAAALNGGTTGGASCATSPGNFDCESAGAVSQFFNGNLTNITVATSCTVSTAAAQTGTTCGLGTCPGAVSLCYTASITKKMPIEVLGVVGFLGDTTISGRNAQTIKASAIANASGISTNFCTMALGTGSKNFVIDGGPNVNMAGCDWFSNADLTCHGANSDTGVEYGYAVGTSSCGVNQVSGATALTDPYSVNSANPPIPANPCGGLYPQVTGKGVYPNVITQGSFTATSVVKVCGDVELGGNIAVTGTNVQLVIYNGQLNLNGYTFSTSGSTAGATIIFTGTVENSNPVYTQTPTGSGSINIAAPTSGTFKGVAIMQDDRLTGKDNSLDFDYAGNTPSLFIQGLIDIPNSNLTISGAIDHNSSSGLNCIGIVAKTILINGTGSIFDDNPPPNGVTADCPKAGLSLPPVPGTSARVALSQ